jgi:hypothetical protein
MMCVLFGEGEPFGEPRRLRLGRSLALPKSRAAFWGGRAFLRATASPARTEASPSRNRVMLLGEGEPFGEPGAAAGGSPSRNHPTSFWRQSFDPDPR